MSLTVRETSIAFAALLGAAGLLELARGLSPAVGRVLERLVGPVFRPDERVSGATLLAAGYALAWWLFPGAAAARGIAVAAVADPAASWAGSVAGPGTGRKTWVGTTAAVLVAAVVLLASGAGLARSLVAALAAGLAERVPRLDNLTVPLATAAALRALD
jgi:dolichol kinase